MPTVKETFEREGTQDSQWHRTYKRTWLVQLDSYGGPVTVRSLLPVAVGDYYAISDPVTGAPVEYDHQVFINKITCNCTSADGLQWTATAEYEHYNPTVFPQNPLEWPIKISWGTTKFDRECQEDKDGNAILNSASMLFDPPVTADDSRINLKIEKNDSEFDPSVLATYKDAINSDTFYGGDPGTWKLCDITADLEFNQDSGTADGFYYKVTYTFEYRPEGWQVSVLDRGLFQRDGSGNLTPILDADGDPVTEPALLDGTGLPLDVGVADPVFMDFDVYPELVFADLGLDPTGAPGQPWA